MPAPIRNIGLVAFKEISEVRPVIQCIENWAKKHPDLKLYIYETLKESCSENSLLASQEELKQKADLIVSIGGDGTVLSTARFFTGCHIPLVGVNLGRLGFLADISLHNLEESFDLIISGQYRITERMMLSVRVHRGSEVRYEDQILNDVVFSGQMGRQMIDLKVDFNGRYLSNYWVDGLIISTPTGSTAYSLSAGGPILYPNIKALMITPINPKSLSVRTIVLPTQEITTVVNKSPKDVQVRMVTDGRQECEITQDDLVEITQNQTHTIMLRPMNVWFIDNIRNKLGWSGSQVFQPDTLK